MSLSSPKLKRSAPLSLSVEYRTNGGEAIARMPQIEEIADEPEAGPAAGTCDEEPEECKAPSWLDPKAVEKEERDQAAATREDEGAKTKPEPEVLTPEEREKQEKQLEVARNLKALGNQLFGEHDYQNALEKYTEAIEAAPQSHKEQSVFYNNRATCHFKLGNHKEVISDCSAALTIDADYSKCLLRRAQVSTV